MSGIIEVIHGGLVAKEVIEFFKEKISDQRAEKLYSALVTAVGGGASTEETLRRLDEAFSSPKARELLTEANRRVFFSRSRELAPRLIAELTVRIVSSGSKPRPIDEALFDAYEALSDFDLACFWRHFSWMHREAIEWQDQKRAREKSKARMTVVPDLTKRDGLKEAAALQAIAESDEPRFSYKWGSVLCVKPEAARAADVFDSARWVTRLNACGFCYFEDSEFGATLNLSPRARTLFNELDRPEIVAILERIPTDSPGFPAEYDGPLER